MATPDRRNRLNNVDAVKFDNPQPSNKKKWLLFIVCTLAVLLLGALVVFGIKYYNDNMRAQNIVYTAHVVHTTTANTDEGDIAYAPYRGDVVMASRNEIVCYNTAGEENWSLDVGVLKPFIKVNGSYILVAGKSTKDYLLIKDGKILLQANSTYAILNAGVAANGTFFIVEDEPYYKGLLTVYDSKNKSQFVWHSGNSYIIDAALNDRASQIAITTLSAAPNTNSSADTENTYSASVLLYKLHEAEPYKTYSFDQKIAASVFHASGRYIVVTDSEILAYSTTNGEQVWSYPFTPHTLQRVDFEDNKLALLTMAEDGTQTLHLLRADGKLSGKVEALKNAGAISMTNGIVGVAGGSTLSVYNTGGLRRCTVTLPKTYNDICLFNNGQYILGVNNIVLDILSSK